MALGGAAAGAATNLWKSKVQQVQPFGWRSLLMDTGVGALGGAVGGAAGKALAPIAGKALAKASVAGKAALGKAGTAIKSGVNAAKGGKAASTAARACSFSAPTLVLMGDGSTRPISQIAVGDEVTATDPETGEQAAKKVLQLFVHTDDLVNLEVEGEVLETTEDHPFWNVTDQAFQRADELDAGDQLLTADGQHVTVRGIRQVVDAALAYNLEVDAIHTYYVLAGVASVLVHNADAGCANKLRNALNAAGDMEPATPHSPHHIVAGNAPKAAPARAQLDRFGIGVNDAENGVWLPRGSSSPNPNGLSVHSKVHTNDYYAYVNDLMGGARSRSEALDVMGHVRRQLQSGNWP